jgi:hypothetical protein
MAKLTGPLFSLKAQGTYRGLITFRALGDVTHTVSPASSRKERSTLQIANAQKVSDMASAWSALSSGDKDTWNACGATYGMTGRQLFWQQWYAQGSSTGDNPVSPC